MSKPSKGTSKRNDEKKHEPFEWSKFRGTSSFKNYILHIIANPIGGGGGVGTSTPCATKSSRLSSHLLLYLYECISVWVIGVEWMKKNSAV